MGSADGELLTWLPCKDTVLASWFGDALQLYIASQGEAEHMPNVYVMEFVKRERCGRCKMLSSEDLNILELEGVAVTATVNPAGKLGKISGLWEKLGEQTIDLARRGLLHTVVVAAEQDDVPEAYLRFDADPLRVLKASTVFEAIQRLDENSLHDARSYKM